MGKISQDLNISPERGQFLMDVTRNMLPKNISVIDISGMLKEVLPHCQNKEECIWIGFMIGGFIEKTSEPL